MVPIKSREELCNFSTSLGGHSLFFLSLFFFFFSVGDRKSGLPQHYLSGGGIGGPPATAWSTGAPRGGAALRGQHAPLLQPGAAGREAVAMQRSAAGARGVCAQPTATAAGAFLCRFDRRLYQCCTAVCVCVFSSHSFWTSSWLDVPAGVTQEEGHTGFLIHLLSAVRAFSFSREKDSAFPFPRRP